MPKKLNQWIRDRAKLLKEASIEGRISLKNGYPEGICEDCGHWHRLDPDHRKKRSQGGSNDRSNIDWVCNSPPCMCHDKRDNQGDPMQKKDKSKKADWQKPHSCKHCKQTTGLLICHNCGKVSV